MYTNPPKMPQQYPRSGIFPPIFDQDMSSGTDDDVTLNSLKEIVSRQQKEIENHQQKLLVKEQRLKFLKQPENSQLSEEAVKLMREKVEAQEFKLEKLREMRGQVDQQRMLNISELESIRILFKDKERELANAVAKVEVLSGQLDVIKQNQKSKATNEDIPVTAESLEKLKSDLRLKTEANDKKNKELDYHQSILKQKNEQVSKLDSKIEELQQRLKKRKTQDLNPVILGQQRNPNPNVATVEPSIRRDPIITTQEEIIKPTARLAPNPQDPRYQTLPNSFKYSPGDGTIVGRQLEKTVMSRNPVPAPQPNQVQVQRVPMTGPNANHLLQQPLYDPIKRVSPTDHIPNRPLSVAGKQSSQTSQNEEPSSRLTPPGPSYQTAKYIPPPAYRRDTTDAPRQQPVYTSASQLPSRPQVIMSGDANNNVRRNVHDHPKPDKIGSIIPVRPMTSSKPVNAPYKPMYASRSVIADTYMKRLGPRPIDPRYSATAPHSIPAFHPENSIISDKLSSKNNTLRSLRRRHSYTETDETKIELALGPREPTPGSAESPREDSPKPKDSTSSNDSTESDVKIPNSGIVARLILKKEIGQKRNFDRRVTFDPHALLLDASLEGEYELVKRSAGEVKDASAPNDEGITALHNAICAGHFDIVKFLVKFGVDVNSQDIDGWTPLHCAASCNNLSMVKFLVEHGACIYATTVSDHETPAEKCEEDEDGFDGCSQYLYGIQEKLGVLNNGIVCALFDYQAMAPDELSFKIGHKLSVIRNSEAEEKEWWWSRYDGKEGYIPRTFLGLFSRIVI